ncbi:hypothetical protein BJY04DRAFT_230591 [Aspergillus karnatakaensis]|uniref:FAD-dependent oxidoreductase n=1 Tax=Aspergillus karnatakaensis TaxID=1810916 RepID=UPI003CCD6DF4
MEDRGFRVIIVGGSIAGLTLAHCLHHANIDHIVLEKRSEIAPQEGASIGLWPNGSRILDQLGLFEDIAGDTGKEREPLSRIHIAYPDGFVFSHDMPQLIYERFGYGILFAERQKILETLYRRYPDKSNILLNRAVANIEKTDEGVSVRTADGSSYHGTIVVGADGVHSRVRSEMWRLADSVSPELITLREKQGLTAEYACIYGISSSIPGLMSGENVNVYRSGFTALTFHSGEHVYWFMIKKLDRKYTYPDIPRFSLEDAEDLCAQFADVAISGDVSVRDVWDSRKVASMTAMEEGIFPTWTHGRIVLLGDAVRKMTVITGQGANSAIEDAAVLATILDRLNRCGEHKHHPTQQEIAIALSEYQKTRYRRSKTIYDRSRFGVRAHTCDGLAKRLIGRYIMPHKTKHLAEATSALMADAPRVDFLPLPGRSLTGWERYCTLTGNGRNSKVWWMLLCLVLIIVWILLMDPRLR